MITKADLRDDGRLMALYRGAVQNRLISRSTADALHYVAAAEHAVAVARDGTAGNLFAWMISGNRWWLISEAEETRAVARLKRIKGREPKPRRRDGDPDADLDEKRNEASRRLTAAFSVR